MRTGRCIPVRILGLLQKINIEEKESKRSRTRKEKVKKYEFIHVATSLSEKVVGWSYRRSMMRDCSLKAPDSAAPAPRSDLSCETDV
jgi:hypothetical protein